MSNVQRWYRDNDRDGTWDQVNVAWNYTDAEGKLDYRVETADHGADGIDITRNTDFVYNAVGQLEQQNSTTHNADGSSSAYNERFAYDDQGRLNGKATAQDWEGDGVWNNQSWMSQVYTERGQLLQSVTNHDYNGDNVIDGTYVLTYTYDELGRVVMEDNADYHDGALDQATHLSYVYEYGSNGKVSQLTLPSYDPDANGVAWKYLYYGSGQLRQVKVQDEDVFGDDRFRNEEYYRYGKNGELTESNIYTAHLNDTYVLEVKTKFAYWDTGLIKSETISGQDFDWRTVEAKLIEYWHDSSGRNTHVLTSFDEDLNGVWDAGTRTLEVKSYHDDGTLASHLIDYNTGDGIHEFLYVDEAFLS